MSHLRMWHNNGVLYFSGQIKWDSLLRLPEGQFGPAEAAIKMRTLANCIVESDRAYARPVTPSPKVEPDSSG